MSILKNAIAAIQVGVEDYRSLDDRRALSALRNLHAGILLLAKEQLCRLSPPNSEEALLKQNFKLKRRADGTLMPIGVGKKTADVETIKGRFADMGIRMDWAPLNRIQAIRNSIEHYYFKGTGAELRAALSDAQQLVHSLLVDVLVEEPVTLLGKACWEVLLEQKVIADAEARACKKSLADVKWLTERALKAAEEGLRCPKCRSNLVRHDGTPVSDPTELELVCSACGGEFHVEDCLVATLNDLYYADAHYPAGMEDEPVQPCPDCGARTYVLVDAECASCGFAIPDDAECAVCGMPLTPEDYGDDGEGGRLCSYHQYTTSKDD